MKQAQVPLSSLCYYLLSLHIVCCDKHSYKLLLCKGDVQFRTNNKKITRKHYFLITIKSSFNFLFQIISELWFYLLYLRKCSACSPSL